MTGKSEAEVMGEARLIAGLMPGVRLYRNNTGALKNPQGRKVEFGLCPGSSDLIGFQSITITLDMVGKKVAQFVACECKAWDGTLSEEQENFIEVVNSFGGKAFAIWDAAELKPNLANQPK